MLIVKRRQAHLFRVTIAAPSGRQQILQQGRNLLRDIFLSRARRDSTGIILEPCENESIDHGAIRQVPDS